MKKSAAFTSPAASPFSSRAARLAIAVIVAALAAPACFGYQSSRWRHASSERFVVSYDQRTESLVGEALGIAEETWRTLAQYFGFSFRDRKIAIVLSDASDDPNGATYERELLVIVDCRRTLSLLRGEHDWLRAVLTHELSHAYSLDAFKSNMIVRGVGALDSERENASASASYYWGANELPAWFIEGLAQMGSQAVEADSRDPVREMVLRDAAASGRLLGLDEMARFEGTSLEAELAYNQGYSLLDYLERTRQEVPIRRLCAFIRSQGFASGFQRTYGKSLASLYAQWKSDLTSRSARPQSWETGSRLFERDGPFVLETACASSASLVVANWGNDYSRFGLFSKGRNGFSRVSDETGASLREDRSTGAVLFSKRVYDYGSGVEDYDLFSIDPAGSIRRLTRGARCLAFDSIDGQVIYARYESGTTSIVVRAPDGAETELARLPYGSAVNSISAISRGSALVALGTGSASRVAIAAEGGLRYLWDGVDAADPCYAGDDRVLFCSSIGGSPQIYWADLSEDPRAWYQVTNAPGGARFPRVEREGSGARLFFSQYEGGGYRLRSADGLLKKERGLKVEGALASEPAAESRSYRSPSGEPTSNTVVDFWPITIGLAAERPLEDSSGNASRSTDYSALFGIGCTFFDAPGTWALDLSTLVQAPVLRENSISPWLTAEIATRYAIGPSRLELGFEYETVSAYAEGFGEYSQAYSTLSASSKLQVASNQAIGLALSSVSYVDTTRSLSNEFFHLYAAGLRWRLADTTRSVFDQARLGGDVFDLSLAADVLLPQFPDDRYYTNQVYRTSAATLYRLAGSAGFHALVGGGKFGVGGEAGASTILGAVSGSTYTPNVLPSIGGSSSFAGYPSYYARVTTLASGSIGFEVNPFVERRGRTSGLQRASLAFKVEGGVARYFDGELKTGYPLSLEASLRHRFYQSPRRESSAYLTFAVPLNDFMKSLDDAPFQIYAGYSF